MYSQMWGHCLKCLFFPLFFSGELLCILWALEFFSLPVWLHWPLSSYWTGSMSYYPVRHQCCQQFLGLCKCSICVCGMEWIKVWTHSQAHGISMWCLTFITRAVGLKTELREAQIFFIFIWMSGKCALANWQNSRLQIFGFVSEPWLLPWLDLHLVLHDTMLITCLWLSLSWAFVLQLSSPHQAKSLWFTSILMSLTLIPW